MSTIPCYQERLKGMIFKLQFPERLAEIRSVRVNISQAIPTYQPLSLSVFATQDLEVISTAALTLQQNKNFKKILEVCMYDATWAYLGGGA